jgi:pyruvate dehydrogenase E2 component (dihydrolipoamide acetyltransferase)
MFEVRLPQLRDDVEESLIVIWFVSEGDRVEKGDRLVEVQTEKAIADIEAEESGTIREILIERGETARAGEVLAVIDPEGSQIARKPKEPSRQEQQNSTSEENREETLLVEENMARVAPGLRKLAKELGVQLEMVKGTGRNGKITEADIRRVAGDNSLEQRELQSGEEGEPETVPLAGIRGTIARRMLESLQNSAQLTETAWADVTELSAAKEGLGDKAGWTALAAKAVAQALKEHPQLNALIADEQIRLKKEIHLGFAVDTDQGLQVAVIRNADQQNPADLHHSLAGLAEKARSGTLSIEESAGSTFTITSLGTHRIQFFTPIINPPEVAILGLGSIEAHLVARDGEISERQRLPLSLTFDHRAIDGAPAAQFLEKIIDLLENPEQLLG